MWNVHRLIPRWSTNRPLSLLSSLTFAAAMSFFDSSDPVHAQEAAPTAAPAAAAPLGEVATSRGGWLIPVELPIRARGVDRIVGQLESISQTAGPSVENQSREVVVLQFDGQVDGGEATAFEDALRLARTFSNPEFRRFRFVAWIDGAILGHATLPLLACDTIVASHSASIGNASAGDPAMATDETVQLTYRSIASRRGLFPIAVADALVSPSAELVLATTLDGTRRFVTGDELATVRSEGTGWNEEVWSAADEPLSLSAQRLRSARIASHVVGNLDEARSALELARLVPLDQEGMTGQLTATLLPIVGAISRDRVRRWELNLSRTIDANETNLCVVNIDSSGGNLDASVQLAGTLSSLSAPVRRVAGYVSGQSLGDASLIATSCRPLYLHPETTLGGPGGQAINREASERHREAIEQIARDARRPMALMLGLLDPTLEVYLFTHRRTGQQRYDTDPFLDNSGPRGGVAAAEGDGDREGQWIRGPRIDLSSGLSSAEAIRLGLAEGEADSIDSFVRTLGLSEVPLALRDQGIVHFVEWLGGLTGFSIFLLLIGLVTLSIEAGAPGLSIPGFISLVCFALYFWIQFLSGTAEWLEILAFVLGIACIAIEVFLLPGIGVFGIGGLVLVILGLVLTSQTFVIPKNTYQFTQLTQSLWLVLAAFGAVMLGLFLLKYFLPQTRFMKGLALEGPSDEWLDRSERLVDYSDLVDRIGVATTPLRPAGKIRIDDILVQVVSDGTAVSTGESVRVIEVHGNRVVVTPLE